MPFTDYPGFTIIKDPGIKRPKGAGRKKKQKADRLPTRGDAVSRTEEAIWLNPRYRASRRVSKAYID